MKHIGILLMLAACSFGTGVHAQGLERTVEERLKDFFSNYSTSQAHIGKSSLKSSGWTIRNEPYPSTPMPTSAINPLPKRTSRASIVPSSSRCPDLSTTMISRFMPTDVPSRNLFLMRYAVGVTGTRAVCGKTSATRVPHGCTMHRVRLTSDGD